MRMFAVAVMLSVLGICGCHPWGPQFTKTTAGTNAAYSVVKQPCEPSVAEQSKMKTGLIHAPIVDISQERSTRWSDKHKTKCPENMRTVLWSQREASRRNMEEDWDKWFAEHTYCEPDGLKP